MRITYLDLPDDLAAAAGELWPDSTWAELIEYALAVVIADARAADAAQVIPEVSPDADEEPSHADTHSDAEGMADALRWVASS